MMIFPEIGLRDGACVTWRRGQTVRPIIHDVDPVGAALAFARDGAEWLHVTDHDAKGYCRCDNTETVEAIIDAVDVPVQVAGGILKLQHVDQWMERGAGSVVIGSAAMLNPRMVADACARHPFAITLAINIWQGSVMVDGWTRPSGVDPLAFAQGFEHLALAGLLVADIDYDRDFPEGSLGRIAALARAVRLPVTASGVTKSMADLATLAHVGSVSGILVGSALYSGALRLEEAQREAGSARVWPDMIEGPADVPIQPHWRETA